MSISLFQSFLVITSGLVCFYNLKFLLYMIMTYATNVTFILDTILGPGNNLVRALFLKLEFCVIFKILVFKNNDHRLAIFPVWKKFDPKVLRIQEHIVFLKPTYSCPRRPALQRRIQAHRFQIYPLWLNTRRKIMCKNGGYVAINYQCRWGHTAK